MSATGFLEETLTRHAIYTERYGGGVHKRLQPILSQLSKDVRELLNDQMTSFEASRRRAVGSQIRALITGIMDEYDAQFIAEMNEFAQYEVPFNTKATQQVMSVQLAAVAPERIEAMLTETEMHLVSGRQIKTYTVDSMLDNFRQAVGAQADVQIRRVINAGVANGDSANTITRLVANEVSSSISRGTVNAWAKSNVLTTVKAISQEAMNETVRVNSDLFDREQWSSTLDRFTSNVCISRDSQLHKVGIGPYPPAHYRCRSVRLPFIEPEYAIIRESTRASSEGPVDSRTTYQSWLRRQSDEFQNDVLGVERAKLFREDKITVKDLVDDQGRTLTLAELRKREGLTLAD